MCFQVCYSSLDLKSYLKILRMPTGNCTIRYELIQCPIKWSNAWEVEMSENGNVSAISPISTVWHPKISKYMLSAICLIMSVCDGLQDYSHSTDSDQIFSFFGTFLQVARCWLVLCSCTFIGMLWFVSNLIIIQVLRCFISDLYHHHWGHP